MASSSSTILTNILEDETAEWRETIQTFMVQKNIEFRAIMKSSIEKTISEKIGNFYNRSFDHDDILFDTNPGEIGKRCIAILQTQLGGHNAHTLTIHLSKIKTIETHRGKCFILEPVRDSTTQHRKHYIFKTFIIVQLIGNWQGAVDNYEFHNHTFPTNMLFALKYFQLKNDYNCTSNILKVYNDHPEYFTQNCSDFESVCKREYEMIKTKKVELQQLVDENRAKIDHYRGLEEQIRSIELEKLAIEEEKNRLKEGKELLLLAKRKIAVMKTDIEKERQQLEEEKTKQRDEQFDMEGFLKTE